MDYQALIGKKVTWDTNCYGIVIHVDGLFSLDGARAWILAESGNYGWVPVGMLMWAKK